MENMGRECLMFSDVYKGKRVLVTGHTGFKGSWLCTWLLDLGAEVAGYSLDIPTTPSNFEVSNLISRITHFDGDVRDRENLNRVFESFQPEIVFHLAAQAIVRRSYEEPVFTFETNALGTMNVLECIRRQRSVQAAVIITSDKCYQNIGWLWGYRENDRLGGEEPYSASKACAEIISSAFMHSYFQNGKPAIATTRAGNAIGGGDWAPDRIVPDCVRAWSMNRPVKIRNSNATRPWQHVLEPLSGYLWLGANLWKAEASLQNESFNFGPLATIVRSVADLVNEMTKYWKGAGWETENEICLEKPEPTSLKLNCDKALQQLNWRAVLSFEKTVRFTCEWYRVHYKENPGSMFEFTMGQIHDYASIAAKEGLLWTS